MQFGTVKSVGNEVGKLLLRMCRRGRVFRTGEEMCDEAPAKTGNGFVTIERICLGGGCL